MKLLLRGGLLFFFLFLILGQSHAMGQFFVPENPLIGEKAPDFTLKLLNGEQTSLAQYRGEQSAIVFFWATWCPHCRHQLDQISKMGDQFAKDGIKMILVDLGESEQQVKSYMTKYKIQYDVFLDTESAIAEKYTLIGVPTFFFIDQQGIVKAVEHVLPEDYKAILSPAQHPVQAKNL